MKKKQMLAALMGVAMLSTLFSWLWRRGQRGAVLRREE